MTSIQISYVRDWEIHVWVPCGINMTFAMYNPDGTQQCTATKNNWIIPETFSSFEVLSSWNVWKNSNENFPNQNQSLGLRWTGMLFRNKQTDRRHFGWKGATPHVGGRKVIWGWHGTTGLAFLFIATHPGSVTIWPQFAKQIFSRCSDPQISLSHRGPRPLTNTMLLGATSVPGRNGISYRPWLWHSAYMWQKDRAQLWTVTSRPGHANTLLHAQINLASYPQRNGK